MKQNIQYFLPFLLAFFPLALLGQDASDSSVGAVIVVASEGKVSLLGAKESDPSTEPKVGEVIPQGRFLQTDQGSKLTLLLSNGTLLTVQEKTKMKVGSFKQTPFDSQGKKVADLEGEPSNSAVELDMDFGSLVVKTKKLNKGSSFNINSPTGTAGVRGTEFQLAQNPGAGVQLDVTESTVAFTPPGGQPMPVSQGQGLDVSSTGQISPRPVNPAVAQNITATNQAATEVSADISMDAVSDAMAETAEMSSESDAGGDEGESNDDSSSEESSDGESTESDDSGEPSSEGESGSDDQSATESADPEPSDEAMASSSNEVPADDPAEPVDPADSNPLMEESLAATATVETEVNIEEVIEQNPDAKQMQETGKKGATASELSKFPFNEELLSKYRDLPEELQTLFLGMDFEVVERLLSIQTFGSDQASKFLGFSSEAQSLILGLEDIALVTLLDQDIDEALILSALSPETVVLASSDNLPTEMAGNSLDDKVLALGDSLRASGNTEIYEEVLEMAGGEWTEEWIRVAEVANLLSSDITISESSLPETTLFTGNEALSNPFFKEISSLYDILVDDTLVAGDDVSVIGGQSVTVSPGSYDLADPLGDASSLVIGASETFSVSGEVKFLEASQSGNRLIVMSGESISAGPGSSITSSLSDLVVATRGDVLLDGARLESAREVAVRSLRDIDLKQSSLIADSKVQVKASQDLNVDGLELSQSMPSLIMEATTIRLSNVDFPSATQVQLNSLKGPIDGKYPNFGTSIPATQQLGRVNFIDNVRSGGNLLQDRAAFDQFGGNVNIGKLP